MRNRSSANPRTSSSTSLRSPQKVLRTCSAVCFPISNWKSICKANSRDLRRVPMEEVGQCSVGQYKEDARTRRKRVCLLRFLRMSVLIQHALDCAVQIADADAPAPVVLSFKV